MRVEKKAALVASAIAFVLLIFKLAAGIISGSVAILASAIDSLLDIAISFFNFFALQTAEKEADERFNFGRGKIEAMAAVFEGVVITLSGLYILYLSINKLIHETKMEYLSQSIVVMVVSTLITLFLVLYLLRIAKVSNSMVIKADALHYKTDLLTNGGILLSLGLIYFTGWHIIDAIVGILIAFYIVFEASKLIKEGGLTLLDVALDPEMVQKIISIIKKQQDLTSYHWLQTRQSGKDIFVSVHLVFDEEISLLKAHTISDAIEAKIKKIDPRYNWRLNIHLDPHDDSD